jgi:hypothetical protein
VGASEAAEIYRAVSGDSQTCVEKNQHLSELQLS